MKMSSQSLSPKMQKLFIEKVQKKKKNSQSRSLFQQRRTYRDVNRQTDFGPIYQPEPFILETLNLYPYAKWACFVRPKQINWKNRNRYRNEKVILNSSFVSLPNVHATLILCFRPRERKLNVYLMCDLVLKFSRLHQRCDP